MNEIYRLLEILRGQLSPSGFLGRVDTAACMETVDELQARLPELVKKSDEVYRRRNEILNAAQADARKIVDQAVAASQRMVSDSVVLERARQESDAALRDARQTAGEHLAELAAYLDNLSRRAKEDARRAQNYNSTKRRG